MDVIAFLIANAKATVLKQPRETGFDHPPVLPRAASVLAVALLLEALSSKVCGP